MPPASQLRPLQEQLEDPAVSETSSLLPPLAQSTTGPAEVPSMMRAGSNRAAASAHGGHEAISTTEEEPAQCRICFETHSDESDPLISPCRCAGSSRHIHRQCLRKWRESALQNPRSLAYYRCEVCHFEYKFLRSDFAALLSHPTCVAAMFTLMLFVSTLLLGYVPLVQAGLRMAGAGAAWHAPESPWAFVLLHVVNGLLLVGWAGGLLWLIARCPGSHSGSSCYCPGCYMWGDCTGLMAGGEACGPVVVVLLVVAAVLGLIAVLPYAYAWLYHAVRRGSEATVRMVENVGPDRDNDHAGREQGAQRVPPV